MNILTIETTCDETAAAVVTDRLEVLSSVVASQDELHRRFGGVVPEIASRAHLERILPVIHEALERAGLRLGDIGAVAVANTPGLAGSLLVGLVAAKTLCVALDIPLVAVNHLQAHVYACRLAAGREVFPCVGLVVSGGHTSLYRCPDAIRFELLGTTIDDAAGEAFDKTAQLLGLGYPGGPAVAQLATHGDAYKYKLPRPMLASPTLDFSFAGLKTAVLTLVNRAGPEAAADIAAAFQIAVVDVLAGKALAALEATGLNRLVVAGGVGANRALRARLDAEARLHHFEVYYPPLELCTDNGAMIAYAGALRLAEGRTDGAFSVRPRWELAELKPVDAT